MSGLFKSPSPPPQSTKAMEETKEIQEKQEARIKRQEAEEQRRLAASISARRTGGMRSLLSPTREDAQRGLSRTLGGSE